MATCRVCGVDVTTEVHENRVCYDCWSKADLKDYQEAEE